MPNIIGGLEVVLLCLFAFVLYLFAIVAGASPRLSDVPAWVQAIGSLGVISAAIWISREQYRRDARLEQRRNADSIMAVAFIVGEACDLVHSFMSARMVTTVLHVLQAEERKISDESRIAEIFNFIGQIPMHTLPNIRVMSDVIEFRRVLKTVRTVIGSRQVEGIDDIETLSESYKKLLALQSSLQNRAIAEARKN